MEEVKYKSIKCIGKCDKPITEKQYDGLNAYILLDSNKNIKGYIHKKCLLWILRGIN